MKTILILALTALAHAGTCTVGWDAATNATAYEVWRGAEKLATVSGTEATLTLPDDVVSTLHVIAVNGPNRSEPSNILHVLPYRPQFSLDLTEWESAPSIAAKWFRKFVD